jgi:hypothetical protein
MQPRTQLVALTLVLAACGNGVELSAGTDGTSGGSTGGGSSGGTAMTGTTGSGSGTSGSSAGNSGGPTPRTFAGDIQPIIEDECSGFCHFVECQNIPVPVECEDAASADELLLDGDAATNYDALVDVESKLNPPMFLVSPGSPSASFLWHKLNDTQRDDGVCTQPLKTDCGDRMPSSTMSVVHDPLPPATLAIVQEWIEQGAPP